MNRGNLIEGEDFDREHFAEILKNAKPTRSAVLLSATTRNRKLRHGEMERPIIVDVAQKYRPRNDM